MFGDLTVKDVSHLTPEELISFCSTFKEKVCLTTFIKDHLVHHLVVSTVSRSNNTAGTTGDNRYLIPGHGSTVNAIASGYQPVSRILNFAGFVWGVESTVTDLSKVSIRRIEELIKKAHGDKKPDVVTLDLSYNYLTSLDMPFVFQLASYTQCQVLKVRSNYIQKTDKNGDELYDQLKNILNLSSIVYFDITFNPCASIDGLKFFQELDEKQYGKLIFIPCNWIYSPAWKPMIPDSYHSIVLAAHESYYKNSDNPVFSTHFLNQ